MRRFSYRAGAAAACVLGLGVYGLVSTGAAGAATSDASPAGTTLPATVTPVTPGVSPASVHAAHLPAGTVQDCPTPTSLYKAQCQSFIKKHLGSRSTASPADAGVITPTDLQAAYGLTSTSSSGGTGQTVAVVDAFGDPNISSDLAQYRSLYNLPACGSGCFTILNQNGATSPLPAANGTQDGIGWQDETALDVEMVSAICPNCKIDLFEANSDNVSDLGTAVNAAAKAAKFVSNSWSLIDFPGDNSLDASYFNHPGIALTFASGDFGYNPSYPGASGLVTSVGGTYLTPSSSSSTGWSEQAWSGQSLGAGFGTGSGCSAGEGKPSWQTDSGCRNRTQNDVSAVADAPGGINIVSSASDCGGQCAAYGTSAATPIIAAVYALAGNPVAATYPSSYPYLNHSSSDVNDVTSGHDGSCESNRPYLCTGETGFDGPTGWGTPKGAGLFTPPAVSSTKHIVSVANPGVFTLQAGVRYTLPAFKVTDTSGGQTISYSATGLPAGFSINSHGIISGTLSANPVNATVRVTVKDGTGASATVAFGISAVKSLIGSYHAGVGFIQSDLVPECVNDARNGTANGTAIELYTCENVASEAGWSFTPSGAPGLAGELLIHGKCIYPTGNGKVALYTCNGAASEHWYLEGSAGEIVNQSDGLCLNAASSANSTQLNVAACNDSANQAFLVPASPITSGVTGKCLDLSGSSAVSSACNTSTAEQVTLGFDGSLRFGGKCIYKTSPSTNDGTVVGTYNCPTDGSPVDNSAVWALVSNGEIENLLSEKCLDVLGNSATNGTKLVIEDCLGQTGEIWAAS